MMDIAVIKEKANNIDITKIAQYCSLVEKISTVTPMTAPVFIKDFVVAYDYASSMLTDISRWAMATKAKLDSAESIAFLDKSRVYLEANGIKATDDSKKKYIDIDPDVVIIRDLHEQLVALEDHLKRKLTLFKAAHDDIKKIIYHDNQNGYEGI